MQVNRLKGARNTNSAVLKDGLVYTYKGRCYDVLNFTEDMVHLDFIIRSLSKQARFNGNTTNVADIDFFYSVAQHCVLGSQALLLMGKPKEAKYFLFHEGAEAYISDVISPVKLLAKDIIKPIENKISEVIYKYFKVPEDVDHKVLKMVDLNLYEMEATILQGSSLDFDCWTRQKAVKMFRRQLAICDKFLEFNEKELQTGDMDHSPRKI